VRGPELKPQYCKKKRTEGRKEGRKGGREGGREERKGKVSYLEGVVTSKPF
jgi:hypothetical protein